MVDYHRYLKSEEWQWKREYFHQRWPWCWACTDPATHPDYLALHHRTYERLGRERISDLCLLCTSCHTATHLLERLQKLAIEDATELCGYLKRSGQNQLLQELTTLRKPQTRLQSQSQRGGSKPATRQVPILSPRKGFCKSSQKFCERRQQPRA